jgi:hypothetical protein
MCNYNFTSVGLDFIYSLLPNSNTSHLSHHLFPKALSAHLPQTHLPILRPTNNPPLNLHLLLTLFLQLA